MNRLRVLFIGFDPATMDGTGAPLGTADLIQRGVDQSMMQLEALGYDAVYCPLEEPDTDSEHVVRNMLRHRHFGVVVIGAGLRLLAKHTVLFEALVAAVVELSPDAKLAFNVNPGDAAEAVQRVAARVRLA